MVMDIEYYERTMKKMYEAKALIDGIADIDAGRVVDGDSAIRDIRKKYGI